MKSIGIIGLGNMGMPMAQNLIEAGFTVYGKDQNASVEKEFKEAGGLINKTISEMTGSCDLILTSLPSSAAVEAVYLGVEGLISQSNNHKNILLIDTSTVSPEVNRAVSEFAKEREISFLATPVSGGVIGAKNRTLTFMVGGKLAYYEQSLPVISVLGENIFHVGEAIDSGTIAKLINNLLIGFYTAGVSEALSLAEKNGMNLDKLFDMLSVSYGQSRIYERNYKSFIAHNDYQPGFALKLLVKDLGFAMELAEESQLNLPISKTLFEVYKEAAAAGLAEEDMSALYKITRQQKSFIPNERDER